MSTVFVLFLISLHSTISCSFKVSSSLLFEQFLVYLMVVYLEIMSGSLRSLLERHISPLIVFVFECYKVLFIFDVFLCFVQNGSMLL